MTPLAMTSPLAPVVAAVEGLRRRNPALTCSIVPGLMMTPGSRWQRATNPQAAAVLLVVAWTRARRIPLLTPGETFVNRAGQLGIHRATVAVLPDDPAAAVPGVVVVESRQQLLALVAAQAGPDALELSRHVRHLMALLGGSSVADPRRLPAYS
ncbi:hypothetical protein Dvina_44235 [Dactylosporangium vinaceum]|uniref:Uncharacterized protein n=1 Tax=Dactylosporangium vinaceum TaxID=53362 RepID=A0ABV5MGN8_9ACTN|nr:hypothetical protein [Dactylosporangium vinaceum]UAB95010.1 hypothetical protein Dvina_44235 [Dactylosporangium vinaceum]